MPELRCSAEDSLPNGNSLFNENWLFNGFSMIWERALNAVKAESVCILDKLDGCFQTQNGMIYRTIFEGRMEYKMVYISYCRVPN